MKLPKELIKPAENTDTGGYKEMMNLINTREQKNLKFSAVFTTTGILGLGAIKAIKEKGLKIPDDISVLSYDDLPHFAYMDPPVTCLKTPIDRLALGYVRNLVQRLDNKKIKLHQRYLKPELVIRNSIMKI